MDSLQDLAKQIEPQKFGNQPPADPPATPPADPPAPADEPPADPAPPAEPVSIHPKDIFGDEYAEKDWEVVKTEIPEKLKKVAELETAVEELRSKRPEYSSPEIAEFDSFVKNGGPADYQLFQSLKTASPDMDELDALVLKTVLENPSYKGYEEQVKEQLITKYGIADNSGLTPEQVAFNKLAVKKDAEQAKAFIKEQQGKLQVKDSPAVNNEELLAKRSQDWTQAAAQIVPRVTELDIPFVKKEGEKSEISQYMKFKVPEQVLQKVQDQLLPGISKLYDATPETIKQVEAEFKANLFLACFPYILSEALDKKTVELTEAYDKKYGGDPKLGTIGRTKEGTSLSDEQIREKILNM